jgi:phenylacetate-CoA ligase
VTADGKLISPSVLTHPLKPLKGLVMSQIIQESRELVRVLLVLRGGASSQLLDQVRDGMQARLGAETKILIEVVDEIPRGRTGKFRWVISKVPLHEKLALQGNLYSGVDN